MLITEPKQVHDLIAVRLFTFDDGPLTRRLSPHALAWAQNRKIDITVKDSDLLFILPEEMAGYLDWSKVEFKAQSLVDIFNDCLEYVHYFGWMSVRRKFRSFTRDENGWIYTHSPSHYYWLVVR